jgi:hypothetical protein
LGLDFCGYIKSFRDANLKPAERSRNKADWEKSIKDAIVPSEKKKKKKRRKKKKKKEEEETVSFILGTFY